MSKQKHWSAKYGLWAVVTGASDGIGKAMAMRLAEAGLNLVLVARRREMLDQLSDEISERFNVETMVIDADLSELDAVEAVIVATETLDIGLLVASAGFGTAGKFIEMPLERELAMLDVNSRAVLTMSHHFGRRFADQGRGGIVLISSIVAFQGTPLQANYAATKAYIQSFGEALNRELAPFGVDVLVSAPGPINSGFAARADMQMGLALDPETVALSTLNALGRKPYVRPGWLSKLLIGSLSFLPRSVRVRVMGQIMQSMTSHRTQPQSTSLNPSI